MEVANPGILLAFGAGLLSFLSPCCLPLYPSYISYISGVSAADLRGQPTREQRIKAMQHTLFFLLGFSAIFVALGLSTSLLAQFFIGYKLWIQRLGGLLVILFGLALLGVLRLGFLQREKRIQLSRQPSGYLGSAAVGFAFAAGWTPCIGPIMASVLVLAASQPASGLPLMLAYTLGFAIPFLVLAWTLGSLQFFSRYSRWVDRVGGGLLVVMGALLFTGTMNRLTAALIGLYGGWVGF